MTYLSTLKLQLKRVFGRRILKVGIIILTVLLGGGFLVSRIDHSEPLTQEQMTLKPGAIEITADSGFADSVYLNYIKSNAKPPVEYIIDKFNSHDLVMLGESHQIREDCQLIAQLIEPLYRRANVKVLAMELIKTKRNEELNRLLTASEFDEQKIVAIFREDYFYWGFQEYIDILRAVWRFNHTRSAKEAPFRVIGIQPDMNIYHVDCGSLPQKVYQFPRLLRMEELYAKPLMDVMDKKEKVLVQVGYFHTFLNYRSPKVVDGKMYGEFDRKRMGRLLSDKYGDRVFQIDLHVRYEGAKCYTEKPATPVSSLFEKLWVENGRRTIGFDVKGTPLGMLRDTSSYFFAYQKHVTLEDIAEGYILQAPYEHLHCVKWIDGFANAANFEKLNTYAVQRKLIVRGECKTPAELNVKFATLLNDGIRFP